MIKINKIKCIKLIIAILVVLSIGFLDKLNDVSAANLSVSPRDVSRIWFRNPYKLNWYGNYESFSAFTANVDGKRALCLNRSLPSTSGTVNDAGIRSWSNWYRRRFGSSISYVL